MSILIYTYDKTIIVWVSESVFMNNSDVEKYRDSSDNKSDSAYIYIMKQKLMLIRCWMCCATPQIFPAVDNVQTYSNSPESYSILFEQLLNWLAVSVLLIMH